MICLQRTSPEIKRYQGKCCRLKLEIRTSKFKIRISSLIRYKSVTRKQPRSIVWMCGTLRMWHATWLKIYRARLAAQIARTLFRRRAFSSRCTNRDSKYPRESIWRNNFWREWKKATLLWGKMAGSSIRRNKERQTKTSIHIHLTSVTPTGI